MARTQTEVAEPMMDKLTKDRRILHRAYLLHFNFLPSILRFMKSQKMKQTLNMHWRKETQYRFGLKTSRDETTW